MTQFILKPRLLLGKPAIFAIFYLIIQQSIVGLSTYAIAVLAYRVGAGQPFILPLAVFIASLVLVYVPAYFASIALQKAKFVAFNGYIQILKARLSGQTTLYNNHKTKEAVTALVLGEGKSAIDEAFDYGFDVLSLTLNVIINTLVIGFVLDTGFIVAYGAGFLMATAFVLSLKGHIKNAAKNAQDERLGLLAHLHHFWDNSVILNAQNDRLFTAAYAQHFAHAKRADIAHTRTSQGVSSLAMLFLLLPVAFFVVASFWHQEMAILVALAATLPRQIQLLQMGQTLIFYATDFMSIKTRLQGLNLQAPKSDIKARINAHAILVNGVCLNDINGLNDLNDPANALPSNGRLTLTGANGSGKSSYLLALKQALGTKAVYLPAQHQLYFDSTQARSTGQKRIDELTALLKSDLVLLLDEWDANLDDHHKRQMDSLIDDFAKTALVVEVCHYRPLQSDN